MSDMKKTIELYKYKCVHVSSGYVVNVNWII